ncbi:MAG: hypothetical protein ACK5PB_08715 [Pirellula sp.]|jgi:hypothetical protein
MRQTGYQMVLLQVHETASIQPDLQRVTNQIFHWTCSDFESLTSLKMAVNDA